MEPTQKIYRGMRPTVANTMGRPYVEVYRGDEYAYDLHFVSTSGGYGYEWGYSGGGPSDLALSLLADVTGMHEAHTHESTFRMEVVRNLPRDVDPERDADYSVEWELREGFLLQWLSGARRALEDRKRPVSGERHGYVAPTSCPRCGRGF